MTLRVGLFAYVAWNVAIIVVSLWFIHSIYVGEWLWGSGTTLLIVIASRLAVGGLAKEEPAGREHDRGLIGEFERALPMDPTMRMVRDVDFGSDLRTEWVRPLYRFSDEWTGPAREFVDDDLNTRFEAFKKEARSFAELMARETVREGVEEQITTVFPMKDRGGPRPEHVRESARLLNQAARPFYKHYEEFVRHCRRKLAK